MGYDKEARKRQRKERESQCQEADNEKRMTYICAKGLEGLRGKGKENDKEIEEQVSEHRGAAGGAPSDKMSKKASDL